MTIHNISRMILAAVIAVSIASAIATGNFLYADDAIKTSNIIQSGQEKPKEKSKERPKAARFTVIQATSEIKVDGVLDEKAWDDAVVIKLPYEWRPGDNIPPPAETDCLVTFDKDNFYVAFRCYDPDPSKIRAHLMDRDSIETFIQDDHVYFLVDTFNDERRAFQFRSNPIGVQADAIFSDSVGYEDFSWDAIWNLAAKINEWGYAVEFAIPFNQLRFPRTSESQTWGFSAGRSYPRFIRHRMSSHRMDRDISCIICQSNKITGIKGISPGLNLEFDPTLTSIRTDKKEDFPQGPMKSGKVEADPGLTARWGITPNLILNATVNPDFSQVEADVAQLEVNTRFALRYPEKRPFFLEGADFFLTPFEAIFTRTVADPAGGLKITGKLGKNALGIFGVYDRINNLLFPSNQGSISTSLNQDVASGVFRYRRDIGQNSTLGALYTGRAAEDYFNHVAGVDGFLRISRTKQIRFQYLHSETKYPEDISLAFGQSRDTFGGYAFRTDFNHMGRSWLYAVGYRDLSPGFRADYGYIPRVDTRRIQGVIRRTEWGEKGDWYTQLNFAINGVVVYDHEGSLTDQLISPNVTYQGPLQSLVSISYVRDRELYRDKRYDLDQMEIYSEIKPASGFRFWIYGQFGDGIDYQNARKANALNIAPFAEFSLGRHVNITLQHALQRLTLMGSEIFEANLSQVRLIYNLNIRTFVRVTVQYLDVARDPALYLFPVSPKTKTFFTQFLFSYKLNPQTVLFLGYSDNYLGMTGIDVTQTDRTFFVKLGYAWTR